MKKFNLILLLSVGLLAGSQIFPKSSLITRIDQQIALHEAVFSDDFDERLTEKLTQSLYNNQQKDALVCIDTGADLTAPMVVVVNWTNLHSVPPLVFCAICGYEELVDRLIEAGATPLNQLGSEYAELLGVYLEGNPSWYAQSSIVRSLIKAGAHLPEYALTFAAELGDTKVLDMVLSRLVNPSINMPLVVAAQEGHIEIARQLLKVGAYERNENEYSPLMWSLIKKNPEMTELFIKSGAQLTTEEKQNLTILQQDKTEQELFMEAAINGQNYTVQVLTKAGFHPWDVCEVYIEAAQHNHIEIIKLLMKNCSYSWTDIRNALIEAVAHGAEGVVAELIKTVCPKDFPSGYSIIRSNNAQIVKLFINAEVNLEKELYMALEDGYINATKVLFEEYADCTKFQSYLEKFASKNNLNAVEILLESNIKFDYSPALIAAAKNGHIDTVKLFLESNIKFDCSPALIAAAKNGHIDTVKLLIENKVNAKAENGRVATIEAAKKGYAEIVAILRAAGANISPEELILEILLHQQKKS